MSLGLVWSRQMMTLGYEGLTQDSFFRVLRANYVQTIVDIRELPISRKRGFSKSSLADSARWNSMQYIHIGELGCPKFIRHDFRADKDWERYVRRFSAYLDTQDVAMMKLAQRVMQENCCLICFEANFRLCHRSIVSERLTRFLQSDLKVIHLSAQLPKPSASAAFEVDAADTQAQQ